MKKYLFNLLVILVPVLVNASRPPIKFGEVDIEDLEMTHYAEDTSVVAALLCDFGEYRPEEWKFFWKRRTKIFKKEGLNNLVINLPTRSKSEVRGYVYNLVDGKIEREKIKNEHIFLNRVTEQLLQVRVAPPNAREGSIIDIEFSFGGIPTQWRFQSTIPIRHSELIVPVNQYFTFKFQQIGYIPVESYDNSRFIARDVEAFHPEPYISSIENYLTTLIIDIEQVHLNSAYSSASIYGDLVSTWEAVNRNFESNDHFFRIINNAHFFLNDTKDLIESSASTFNEKIYQAVKAVHDHIEWNEKSNIFPNISLKEVWDQGSGSSSDMNFILMSLLYKLNIPCNPMLISTRSNGKINPMFPTINRFNYVITAIPHGEGYILVDASDKFTPPGMLPERCMNDGGFIINDQTGEWYVIEANDINAKMVACNLELNHEGNATGTLNIRYENHGSINFRDRYMKYTSQDEYLEEFEFSNNKCLVGQYSNNLNDTIYGPVVEKMELEFMGLFSGNNQIVTFNPVLFDRLEKNPFKLENRNYPVDFVTPISNKLIFTIIIPDGYIVESLPDPVLIKTETNDLNYRYTIQETGNKIQIMISLTIKKPVFYEHEYQELKSVYNYIYLKEKENIVLKKQL